MYVIACYLFSSSPDVVSLCLLPEEQCKNISAHIQQKLIEAYCWENQIQVVNVDESTLANLAKQNKARDSKETADLYCMLVMNHAFDPGLVNDKDEMSFDSVG